MKLPLAPATLLAALLLHAPAFAQAPAAPAVTSTQGVKTYLTENLTKIRSAVADFQTHAKAYDAQVSNPAYNPETVARLIKQLREDYAKIDSFGYEYIEGIVAGVPSLAKYDIELDAGVPAKGAAPDDDIAPVTITAGTKKIDREGALNNFLIEPTVYGTNEKFIIGKAKLPGLGDKEVGLPDPKLLLALADYAVGGYARLAKDVEAWQPTDKECFEVLVAMTPTLADYFEEWKESKISGGAGAGGGRFVAVSRVSDMRGIMSSTRLAWLAVENKVEPKDAALTSSISTGYTQILAFIDDVESREKQGALTPEAIDALGTQAKEKADKLAVQAAQAAAVLGYPDLKVK